ncbi:MAG: MotA/TolQ/ExbB proton channel family protein [Burkholderiales bacterium]|nr:MotA/TolQ/ExbB proton channel family protein [Burkholderiales bacterium]
MFTIIEAAGWPIWPILIASLVSVMIIVYCLISLRQSVVAPKTLLPRIIQEFKRNGVTQELISKLSAKDAPLLAHILATGLRNSKNSREVMKESIEEAGRIAVHDMERFLTTLGTIASISPLLGLFGTMIGMIELFGSQSASGANPTMLAHGISVALYNTALGLAVAIPSMIFYRHFRGKIEALVVEMEQEAIKLIEIVHGERQD